MAIGWMTILKTLPWSEVLEHAPLVADGAKKLWDRVGRRSEATGESGPAGSAANSTEARLAALEARAAELQEQMLASSALIKDLAEQNAQLVRRLQIQRRWVAALGLAVAAALIGVAVIAF